MSKHHSFTRVKALAVFKQPSGDTLSINVTLACNPGAGLRGLHEAWIEQLEPKLLAEHKIETQQALLQVHDCTTVMPDFSWEVTEDDIDMALNELHLDGWVPQHHNHCSLRLFLDEARICHSSQSGSDVAHRELKSQLLRLPEEAFDGSYAPQVTHAANLAFGPVHNPVSKMLRDTKVNGTDLTLAQLMRALETAGGMVHDAWRDVVITRVAAFPRGHFSLYPTFNKRGV